MNIIGFALAGVIGLSLGLMGGGGSILTVPVFVYVLGFAAKPAIAMSLPVVGATSLVGALGHWRAGNVHLRTALLFGVIAMVGSYFGARLAIFVSGTVQLMLLAIVMLGAAISMLRPKRKVASPDGGEPAGGASLPVGKLVAVGLSVGILTGIVGIGGGFLIVPALVVLGRVPMKQAVGTSLLVIAMNSLSGFAGYFGTVDIPWAFLASFTAVSIAGILVGTYLVRFVSAAALKRGFAVFLLFIGSVMMYQNRSVFTSGAALGNHAATGARK
ncbi:MAG: sulfite exporter TauE/SafE family protein [Gemmatimonadota bacterium]|nr:sulfite exporter TauE/SafE family protein [Gemmatimonadota bacterium]